MAIAKVADRASVSSNSTVTTADFVLSGMTVGNVLVIRTAADNSGSSGAARTVTVTNQSGTPIDTATDTAYQQNNDPGAASAGVTCNVMVAVITATSGTVRVTYSGAVVQAGVAEEWSGVQGVTRVVGTPVGANGTASTNLASCADASVASGNVAYGAMAIEGPSSDTITEDADTTNGSWVSLTKLGTSNATADTNMTVAGGYKITTGTGGQTYNPTINNARDSAGIIVELAAAPIVSASLASSAGGLTGSVTATPKHPATLAAPLGALAATSTEVVKHPATLAASLGALTGSMGATVTAGHATVAAVLASSLGGLTAGVTGRVIHPATVAGQLGGLAASSTAKVTHPASGTGSCGALTAAAGATVRHPATATAPLGELTAGAGGSITHPAVMSAALGGMVATLAAAVGHTANGDGPLGSLDGQLTAAATQAAVLQTILGGLTAHATASGLIPPGLDTDPYMRDYTLAARTSVAVLTATGHAPSTSTTHRS